MHGGFETNGKDRVYRESWLPDYDSDPRCGALYPSLQGADVSGGITASGERETTLS